jgi:chromosome segregation ATPase
MSNTPETDKNVSVGLENADRECVPVDFCRKLERERDGWAAMCGQYKQERDETRNQRDILRLDAQKEAEHHDRMVGELEKVYKERDEAREELKGCKYKNQRISAELLVKLRNAERERDEARSERNEAREALKAFQPLTHHDCSFYKDIMGNCIICKNKETK